MRLLPMRLASIVLATLLAPWVLAFAPFAAAAPADAASSDAAPGMAGRQGPGGGSIIVVLATDAPLLPHQCEPHLRAAKYRQLMLRRRKAKSS